MGQDHLMQPPLDVMRSTRTLKVSPEDAAGVVVGPLLPRVSAAAEAAADGDEGGAWIQGANGGDGEGRCVGGGERASASEDGSRGRREALDERGGCIVGALAEGTELGATGRPTVRGCSASVRRGGTAGM